jgi:F-type H+-transporting ATPase subunit epsilon
MAENTGNTKKSGKKLRLRILAPYRLIYDHDVDFVIIRSSEGDAGIQPGHEPYATMLNEGILVYHRLSQVHTFVVLGGYASVLDDEVTVISEIADHPEKIKQTLSDLAAERDLFAKQEQKGSMDIQLMELGLRRALVRVDVSSYSIIKGRDGYAEFAKDVTDEDDDISD